MLQDICCIIFMALYWFVWGVIAVDCEVRKKDMSRYIGFSLDEKPSRCPRCRFRFLQYVGDR
jgi:hypothetical protein